MIQSYSLQQALRVGIAVFVAVIVGGDFSFSHEGWIVFAAFLTCQATRGTPLRQRIIYFFIVLIVAVFWPVDNMLEIRDRTIDVLIGGFIGVVSGIFIFPSKAFENFSQEVLPVLYALKNYKNKTDWQIEEALTSKNKMYPEWVYQVGFNPGLRAGFRFFLIQLERMTELYFARTYLLKQGTDPVLWEDFSPHLVTVTKTNDELLQVLIDYFSNQDLKQSEADYTSDIAELEVSLNKFVPGSLELLDMSLDYITLAALVRNLKDTRELLLQLIAALPVRGVVA